MASLWTAVAPTMFQPLKALKNLLGLYLNRRQAKALLEQVQASDLNDAARNRISHILRFMLRLPKDACFGSSSPPIPFLARLPTAATGSGSSGQHLTRSSARRVVIGWIGWA
jgi:hypothetical protein